MAGRTDGSSALQDDEPNIAMTSGGASGDELPQPQSLGYRQIMQSVNNSMRSDFTGQALTPNGESPEDRRSKITMNLRNAENNAGNTASTSELDANSGENNVSSDASSTAQAFRNRVGQKGGSESGAQGGDNKVQGGGFLKKKGPLMSIIISLLFGGGGMYMTQASLPFTMLDKINDSFDSINISTNFRTSSLTRSMVKNSNNVLEANQITKKNVFGQEKFAPTKKMKKKLAANGISFGSKKTGDPGLMIYTGKDGVTKKMTVGEFKAEFDANPDFRKAYSNGTKSWKTSVEEFRDGLFDKLLKRFNISKNRFGDYDAKSDPDGKKGMAKMGDDVEASTNGDDIRTKKSKIETEEKDVPDGQGGTRKEKSGKVEAAGEGEQSGLKGAKAKGMAEKLGAVKDVVGSLTTLGCGLTKAYTALKLILAAAQLGQIVATAQEMFEGIDKARAGDAASSPINAIGRSLVEQTSEEREVVDEGTINIKDDNENSDATMDYKTVNTESRSAVQSEGLSSLFTGDPIDASDESVASFVPMTAAKKAIDSVDDNLTGKLGGFGKIAEMVSDFSGSALEVASTAILSYRVCMLADAALAAFDVALDAMALFQAIAGLVTAGTTTVAAIIEEALWKAFKIAVQAAIGIGVSMLIGYLAPVIANIFTRKLMNEFLGEDLGNAVMAGGSAYLSRNHQGGGGLPANENGYMAALVHQDVVNREEAKTDRLARSPFDYTSANTFAGQLAVSLTPIMLQSDSFGSAVGNFGKVIGNSAKSLLPTASAISVNEKVNIAKKQTEDNCPELHALGVVADAFCNPYVTTDFSTIETDENADKPEDDDNSAYSIIKKVAAYDSSNFSDSDIDSVDNPKIASGTKSNLGKFIATCTQRDSPLGIPDENMANIIDPNQMGTAANGVVGAIPIIGDSLSIVSDSYILSHYGFVSGANCVMNDSGNAKDDTGILDPSYDEIKTYSRYIEDQRLAESMGLIEESAVSVFLDEYYKEHPLDNSPEGIMARFSGLTKDHVIAIEDTVEFYTFYLAYDPTDYYPTPAVHKEDPTYTIEDDDFVNDDGLLAIMRACETDPTRHLNVAAA